MNRNEIGDTMAGMETGALPERFRSDEMPHIGMPYADLVDTDLSCADVFNADLPDAGLLDADIMKNEIGDACRESMELPRIVCGGQTKNEYSPLLTAMIKEQAEIYAPDMEMQAEKIKDIYDTASELHYENWKSLGIDERKKALNDFERGIAAVEKRPLMPVEYEELSDGYMGYNNGKKIVILKMVDYLKKALIYGHTSRISS